MFLLTKPNTSCTIEKPASLRSDGVRDHPGMPFGFPSEQGFSFAGIPSFAGAGAVRPPPKILRPQTSVLQDC